MRLGPGSALTKSVLPDGTIKWRNKRGKLHREDGPACEYPWSAKEWYWDGKLHRDDGPAKDGPKGKRWYRNGKFHREDGPACEWADGTREWYRNGKYHRDDGPAVERPDGTRQWYRHGKIHREGGPAAEGLDGRFWFRNGKRHREDGPAIEFPDGTTEWYIDDVQLTPAEVAEIRAKQSDAIGDAFRKGLDHKVMVKAIGKLKTGSEVKKPGKTGRAE